ncbi:MAG: hypothetical protein ACXVFK_11205, partial [Solirubrobacteraceae bacterium]
MHVIHLADMMRDAEGRAAHWERELKGPLAQPSGLVIELAKRMHDVARWIAGENGQGRRWQLTDMAGIAMAGAARLGSTSPDLDSLAHSVRERAQEQSSIGAAIELLLAEFGLLAAQVNNPDTAGFVRNLESVAAAVVQLATAE